MISVKPRERRSYVRGTFSFKVKFWPLTPEEYQDIKQTSTQFAYVAEETISDITDPEKKDAEVTLNVCLIDFLVQMDEKLDRILDKLSEDEADRDLLPKQGIGVSISGSGMNVVAEEPVEPGQIIHADFVLSRIPLVFLDVFGKVLRVTPVDEKGTSIYNLAIEFLDLKPIDRERIIACVFQRERETIRSRKQET
ncbi:MAG: PilZ domain-containing protein [Deltaproteobacteria bacterium]|nr:PilZ domain-containing protein [Deltaproteobacteria bacterium]MBW2079258.1 PilZ domain-containing protein [Deltaproteobacteria bacterium]MBW2340072.1 PilZ domain-containing protein [Deltaproteobacteria bacterium]